MGFFLYKLLPPRPSFAQDMTPAEAATMAEHLQYWRDLMARGSVVVVGPVADPAGTYGIAIVESDDEHAVHEIGASDPAVAQGICRFEVHSMPSAFVRT